MERRRCNATGLSFTRSLRIRAAIEPSRAEDKLVVFLVFTSRYVDLERFIRIIYLVTPYQIIPSKPPHRIATRGLKPNHLHAANAATVISTNQGSPSIGLPSCAALLIQPTIHNRYTAENTSPTAPHSTPFNPAVISGFLRITFQKESNEVLIRIPGRFMPRNPRSAPGIGGNPLATAPR